MDVTPATDEEVERWATDPRLSQPWGATRESVTGQRLAMFARIDAEKARADQAESLNAWAKSVIGDEEARRQAEAERDALRAQVADWRRVLADFVLDQDHIPERQVLWDALDRYSEEAPDA
jgi:hypothetical protein